MEVPSWAHKREKPPDAKAQKKQSGSGEDRGATYQEAGWDAHAVRRGCWPTGQAPHDWGPGWGTVGHWAFRRLCTCNVWLCFPPALGLQSNLCTPLPTAPRTYRTERSKDSMCGHPLSLSKPWTAQPEGSGSGSDWELGPAYAQDLLDQSLCVSTSRTKVLAWWDGSASFP